MPTVCPTEPVRPAVESLASPKGRVRTARRIRRASRFLALSSAAARVAATFLPAVVVLVAVSAIARAADSPRPACNFCGPRAQATPAPQPQVPSGACLPASSLSVLIQGQNVTAYVPNGSWTVNTTGVRVIPLEPSASGSPATIETESAVNSCASDPATGETICTANDGHIYLIAGTTLTDTMTGGGIGEVDPFSGGACTNCGLAIDPVSDTAMISLALGGGTSGFQFLHLGSASPTFGRPITAAGTAHNSPQLSEGFLADPIRHLMLSPAEGSVLTGGDYRIIRTAPSTAMYGFAQAKFAFAKPNYLPNSAAEDCTTGIALGDFEESSDFFVADLSQVKFIAGSPRATWNAPYRMQNLPEFSKSYPFPFGPSGMAVAPGTHLAVVTGKGDYVKDYEGNTGFGVLQLPATSGAGIPSIIDWVEAYVPDLPDGSDWAMGDDPHTVTAYVSPNNGKAYAVIDNESHTALAVVEHAGVAQPGAAVSRNSRHPLQR